MSDAKGVRRAKERKVSKVMREWKSGKLKSSSGKKVSNQKQAIAIAISESQRLGKKKGKR